MVPRVFLLKLHAITGMCVTLCVLMCVFEVQIYKQ